MNTAQSWKYGYFEMRAKMPTGKGTGLLSGCYPRIFKAGRLMEK
jgi:hypothetical protein